MTHQKQTIFMLAGESSGDLHGSHLMKEMKKLNRDIDFCGIGGKLMIAQGLISLVPIKRLSVMGFWEVIKDLRFFLQLKKNVINYIINKRPNKIILIDYPGFNLKIAKEIKQRTNITILYYISPQLWAWKESRINLIKKYIDSLISIFPFEVDWYKSRGLNIQYFGHPLIDNIKNKYEHIDSSPMPIQTIALFPGSRLQEIKRHSPILKNVVTMYLRTNPNTKFIVSMVPEIHPKHYKGIEHPQTSMVVEEANKIFNKSQLAIVASGTATLECALSYTPMIVIYKMSLLSWILTQYFIKVPYASIVNILSQKTVVPECLQGDATAKNIINKIESLIKTDNLNNLLCDYNHMKKLLGNGQAYYKAAQYIINY